MVNKMCSIYREKKEVKKKKRGGEGFREGGGEGGCSNGLVTVGEGGREGGRGGPCVGPIRPALIRFVSSARIGPTRPV